jgi:hypothetical protein
MRAPALPGEISGIGASCRELAAGSMPGGFVCEKAGLPPNVLERIPRIHRAASSHRRRPLPGSLKTMDSGDCREITLAIVRFSKRPLTHDKAGLQAK